MKFHQKFRGTQFHRIIHWNTHLAYGKGFSRSNLNYMRLFYQRFPICEEVPHKLSWTHFCELVKIDDPLKRSFYQQQAICIEKLIYT